MRRSLKVQYVILTIFAFFIIPMIFGCGSKAKLEEQISGTWQRTQGDGSVEINLASNPKSLVVDGKTYAATIDKIDKGLYLVQIKVETGNGNTETWTLHQVWDDNGNSFKLAFNHNGTRETLITAKGS